MTYFQNLLFNNLRTFIWCPAPHLKTVYYLYKHYFPLIQYKMNVSKQLSDGCVMHSVYKHMHAFDGSRWRNAMAKIGNISRLAEFTDHCLS